MWNLLRPWLNVSVLVVCSFAIVSARQLSPPLAPTNLSATASGFSVTLTWSAPTSGPVPDTYIIEAGSFSGGSNLASFRTGNTSPTFSTGGIASGTYYVRVRAANAAGSSTPSNEVVLTVGTPPCTRLPAAPSGLEVTVTGATVSLTWMPSSSGPVSYIIEAGSVPGLSNVANIDTFSSATSLRASQVPPGRYYIRVRAKNSCGTSAPSNEVVAIVGGSAPDIAYIITDGRPGDAQGTIFGVSRSGTVTPIARTVTVPNGVAVDLARNIYVTLPFRREVLRVSLDGTVTTFFSGPPLRNPLAVAVNRAGDVFVADNATDSVFRISADDGSIVEIARLPASPQQLQSVRLGFDRAGNLLVSDSQSVPAPRGTILSITPGGAVTTVHEGTFPICAFAIGPDGTLLVSDCRSTIAVLTLGTRDVRVIARPVDAVFGLAYDSIGGDFVGVTFRPPANRVIRITGSGQIVTLHSGFPFNWPMNVAVLP